MRFLKKPGVLFNAREVYDLCNRDVAPDLKRCLDALGGELESWAADLDSHAPDARLHLIPLRRIWGEAGMEVTQLQLQAMFTRLRSKQGPAERRAIYNCIRKAAPNNKCPLCGIDTVDSLDHHLPQAEYAILSVAPNNLVPACPQCQVRKGAFYPTCAEDHTLHPYFDDLRGTFWLRATMVDGKAGGSPGEEAEPGRFEYHVDPSLRQHSPVMFDRLNKHLDVFDLVDRLWDHAASEYRNMCSNQRHLESAEEIRKSLRDLVPSALEEGSLWRAAMYDAAARSDWFCTAGVHLQPARPSD